MISLAHQLAAGAALEPLHTGNLAPFTALFGVPRWESAAAAEAPWTLRFDTDIANHFAASSTDGETVILDGETVRTTVGLRRKVATEWVLGMDVPYVRHSGGFLDRFVDRWHGLFGLPDGGRDLRARNLLEFAYLRDGVVANALTDDGAGLGDITLTAARVFAGSGLELHAAVKLPSGDAGRFTGSGGMDFSATILRLHPDRSGGRWQGYYWGAGITKLGAGDFRQPISEDWLLAGLLGAAYSLTPRWMLKAQLELNSAPYKSEVKPLGDPAAQLSFGASFVVAPDAALDLALSEDLITNASPDIAFHIGLTWRW